MVRVIVESLDYAQDPLTGEHCELGYGDPETGEVYLEIACGDTIQDRVLVHEIIEMFMFNHKSSCQIPHEQIDDLVKDILDAQKQLRRIRDGNKT